MDYELPNGVSRFIAKCFTASWRGQFKSWGKVRPGKWDSAVVNTAKTFLRSCKYLPPTLLLNFWYLKKICCGVFHQHWCCLQVLLTNVKQAWLKLMMVPVCEPTAQPALGSNVKQLHSHIYFLDVSSSPPLHTLCSGSWSTQRGVCLIAAVDGCEERKGVDGRWRREDDRVWKRNGGMLLRTLMQILDFRAFRMFTPELLQNKWTEKRLSGKKFAKMLKDNRRSGNPKRQLE